MKINNAGLEIIKYFEGCKLEAYRCPAGVATIGYGTTLGVRMGQKISQKQAEDFLVRDVAKFEEAVKTLVKVELNENQFSALVSFTYNVGPDSLKQSTLLRLLNNRRFQDAANQFERWNQGGGKILSGLTKRRAAEKALFLGQNWREKLK